MFFTSMRRFSTFTPYCFSSASAISWEVTEPYRRPPSAPRALMLITLPAIFLAVSCACARATSSRCFSADFALAIALRFVALASRARPLGNRKLRA